MIFIWIDTYQNLGYHVWEWNINLFFFLILWDKAPEVIYTENTEARVSYCNPSRFPSIRTNQKVTRFGYTPNTMPVIGISKLGLINHCILKRGLSLEFGKDGVITIFLRSILNPKRLNSAFSLPKLWIFCTAINRHQYIRYNVSWHALETVYSLLKNLQ